LTHPGINIRRLLLSKTSSLLRSSAHPSANSQLKISRTGRCQLAFLTGRMQMVTPFLFIKDFKLMAETFRTLKLIAGLLPLLMRCTPRSDKLGRRLTSVTRSNTQLKCLNSLRESRRLS
jgi:hypothetical protein